MEKSSLKTRLYEAMANKGKKAADLTRDLGIPKSAISQYLSGKSQNMDSERLYAIAKYLDVDEPWLLGYDVPMKKEKPTIQKDDELSANQKALMDFVKSVPDDKAAMILKVIRSIVEAD